MIGLGQKKMGFDLGADLSGTDYAAIARGFGIRGETVNELADLGPAIERSLVSGLPAVIDCRTRFVPHPMMQSFAIGIGRHDACSCGRSVRHHKNRGNTHV